MTDKSLKLGNKMKTVDMHADPEPILKVLIIVPNYWGTGKTISDAWRMVRAVSGKRMHQLRREAHMVYIGHDAGDIDLHLDAMGNVCHHADYPVTQIEKFDPNAPMSDDAEANKELARELSEDLDPGYSDEDKHGELHDELVNRFEGENPDWDWEHCIEVADELADHFYPEAA